MHRHRVKVAFFVGDARNHESGLVVEQRENLGVFLVTRALGLVGPFLVRLVVEFIQPFPLLIHELLAEGFGQGIDLLLRQFVVVFGQFTDKQLMQPGVKNELRLLLPRGEAKRTF